MTRGTVARVIALVLGLAASVSLALLFLPHAIQPHRLLELPTLGIGSMRLTRGVLDESLSLGTRFLLNNQTSEGRFHYEYDWRKRKLNRSDSQVRQAGAMWGLALIYHDHPTPEVGQAVRQAMDFFLENSRTTPDGRRYVVYPGDPAGSTGTVALCALAHIDYLRAAQGRLSDGENAHYREGLEGYLNFLVAAQMDEESARAVAGNQRAGIGLWHRRYRVKDGQSFNGSSPYYDGEALLALVKAAKYMGRMDLLPAIRRGAEAGYRYNIREALRRHPDSKITKGYYQWSSMAFFELATSGWPDTGKYGDYVLELADWMIDVHRTLKRTRNTAYAYEGIIHAYALAVERGDTHHARKHARVIDTGLEKLTSWQVGSPIANDFIRAHPTDDPMAVGGVQNHRHRAPLRIDVTQHQMHAVVLARRYLYTDPEQPNCH